MIDYWWLCHFDQAALHTYEPEHCQRADGFWPLKNRVRRDQVVKNWMW